MTISSHASAVLRGLLLGSLVATASCGPCEHELECRTLDVVAFCGSSGSCVPDPAVQGFCGTNATGPAACSPLKFAISDDHQTWTVPTGEIAPEDLDGLTVLELQIYAGALIPPVTVLLDGAAPPSPCAATIPTPPSPGWGAMWRCELPSTPSVVTISVGPSAAAFTLYAKFSEPVCTQMREVCGL